MADHKYDALKLEYQLCFPLYAASREVIKQYRPLLEPLGLTYTQYIAMMVIWEHENISVKEIGEKLMLDSGTLTPVLKSLEAKGFIRRERSREDERVLVISITGEGRSLRDEALKIPAALSACVRLDADEAAELYRLLYKIIGAG